MATLVLDSAGRLLKSVARKKGLRLIDGFTPSQRRALTALLLANILALAALGLVLLRGSSSRSSLKASSPLDPRRLVACRDGVSSALLSAEQSALAQTREDGTIIVQLYRPLTEGRLRLDSDAAVWTAMEAVADAKDCLDLDALEVSVILESGHDQRSESVAPAATASVEAAEKTADGPTQTSLQTIRATARVRVADLIVWSLGQIDDAELSLRVDYELRASALPSVLKPTAMP